MYSNPTTRVAEPNCFTDDLCACVRTVAGTHISFQSPVRGQRIQLQSAAMTSNGLFCVSRRSRRLVNLFGE